MLAVPVLVAEQKDNFEYPSVGAGWLYIVKGLERTIPLCSGQARRPREMALGWLERLRKKKAWTIYYPTFTTKSLGQFVAMIRFVELRVLSKSQC